MIQGSGWLRAKIRGVETTVLRVIWDFGWFRDLKFHSPSADLVFGIWVVKGSGFRIWGLGSRLGLIMVVSLAARETAYYLPIKREAPFPTKALSTPHTIPIRFLQYTSLGHPLSQ